MKYERPEKLKSTTYKIKPPVIDSAIYITICDDEVNGQTRPVEVFINSKDMPSFQWVSCINQLLSHQFQTMERFPAEAVEKMVETYDTSGGYIIPKALGKRANSVAGHIGLVLQQHCKALGLL